MFKRCTNKSARGGHAESTNFLYSLFCVLSPNESQDSVEEEILNGDRCVACAKAKRNMQSADTLTPTVAKYILETFPIGNYY